MHNVKIYNRARGRFPANLLAPFIGKILKLETTAHARQQAGADRYGVLTIPQTVCLLECHVVEIETVKGQPVKAVARISHDAERDLVLVVLPPEDDTLIVKTVWCNLKSDQHSTLNPDRLR